MLVADMKSRQNEPARRKRIWLEETDPMDKERPAKICPNRPPWGKRLTATLLLKLYRHCDT